MDSFVFSFATFKTIMLILTGVLFFVALPVRVSGCDISNNHPVTGINYECNNAGTCYLEQTPFFDLIYKCLCCQLKQEGTENVCGDFWSCDEENSTVECNEFYGSSCSTLTQYFYAGFGFRSDEVDPERQSDISFLTNPYLRAAFGLRDAPSLYFTNQVQFVTDTHG